jgi:carbonic anhydrase/SulP family sulfate permease
LVQFNYILRTPVLGKTMSLETASMSFTQRVIKDVIAGAVVFLVALPLCLGVANASRAEGIEDAKNVTIIAGLIAGIIGGVVVGLISNSHTSVSGPAAGLTAVVSAQVLKLGSFEAFLVAVFMAGLIQITLGFLRTGSLAAFFPSSVIKGLLTAIGVILILKQLPHLVGHDYDPDGEMSFFQPDHRNTFTELFDVVDDFHIGATMIGLSSLAILIIWDRIKFLKNSIVPSALIVVLWGTALNLYFRTLGGQYVLGSNHEVKVLEASNLSEFVQQFSSPDFSVLRNSAVYIAAIVIAIVASLETLLNLEAVDRLDPKKRLSNPNRELVAQGVGNSISGLMGGLPITSVIVRSSANINAGAQSKLSTIIHGALLLLCVLWIPRYLNMIPLAALAAILLLTGYKLASWKIIKSMWSQGYQRFLPYMITVIAIVFTDLLIGVVIGLALTIGFIIWSNLKRPSRVIKERHISGDVYRIELANQVSFLNRASLTRVLESVPNGGQLLIDGSSTDYIDPDIFDLLMEFESTIGPARNITVSMVGFKERYNLEDKILYVDYTSREIQSRLTPRDVLEILQNGNQRFRNNQRLHRDLGREISRTAQGQFPIAAVLSCMDSRSPAEILFDVGVGDIFSIRIAGNVAKDKVFGSLEYATAVAKSKLIVVLGHTRCGAVTAAVDFTLGHRDVLEATGCHHLDVLISEIKLALPAVPSTADESQRYNFVDRVACENVRRTIRKIRAESKTIAGLEAAGTIAIVGAIYDISTGLVDFFDLPAGWQATTSPG